MTTQTTLTRPALLAELAAARTNLAIATSEVSTAWIEHALAIALWQDGYGERSTIATASEEACRLEAEKMEAYRKVESLETELLRLAERAEVDAANEAQNAKVDKISNLLKSTKYEYYRLECGNAYRASAEREEFRAKANKLWGEAEAQITAHL